MKSFILISRKKPRKHTRGERNHRNSNNKVLPAQETNQN